MRITSDRPLVLGSASPRRRELLATLAIPFVVRPADTDESMLEGERAQAYLERVALAKLDSVRALGLGPASGVLAADTIVISSGGVVLGKPRSDDEARWMIERLGGSTHVVSTRFVLAGARPQTALLHGETVTTRVTFRQLAPGEAEAYAATGEGRDKAGGYALQGRAAAFIERVDGSHTGVIGLPLSEVVVAMRRLEWL